MSRILELLKSVWGYAISMGLAAVALYVGALKYKDSKLEDEVRDLKNEKRQDDIKAIDNSISNEPLDKLVSDSNAQWGKRNDTK